MKITAAHFTIYETIRREGHTNMFDVAAVVRLSHGELTPETVAAILKDYRRIRAEAAQAPPIRVVEVIDGGTATWRVLANRRLLSPTFNSAGAASIYAATVAQQYTRHQNFRNGTSTSK